MGESAEKECYRCGRKPILNRKESRRTYCYRLDTIKCNSCKHTFNRSCSREEDFRKTCPHCRKREFSLVASKDYHIACKNCDFEFEPLARNAKTCNRTMTSQCGNCQKSFQYVCDKYGARSGCSPSCIAALSSHGSASTLTCGGCGEARQAKSLCKNRIKEQCNYCKLEVDLDCNARNKALLAKCKNSLCKFLKTHYPQYGLPDIFVNIQQWLNVSPRTYSDYYAYTGLKTAPVIISRQLLNDKLYNLNCRKCGDDFHTNSPQKEYCNKVHIDTCKMCHSSYEVEIINADAGFCDVICAHLFNNKSGIYIEKIDEYKNFDKWAKDFFKLHKRKPGALDVISYFNVKRMPENFNKALFDVGSRSLLENIVKAFLEKQNINYLHNRYLLHEGRKRLQIDFFLTDYNIAIEVQDFWSHDKYSNEISFDFGGFKKGPTYHDTKRALAIGKGYMYLELWQDSVISGNFKKEISDKIGQGVSQ